MQTAILGAFPISFTDLWHRLTDSIKTLFMAFWKFSFDSLLEGLTKKEMEKWFKLNLILNFEKIVNMSLLPSTLNSFAFKIY